MKTAIPTLAEVTRRKTGYALPESARAIKLTSPVIDRKDGFYRYELAELKDSRFAIFKFELEMGVKSSCDCEGTFAPDEIVLAAQTFKTLIS